MQTSVPTKIGEGAYGCVFKPSMKCKTGPKFNNNKFISKFMKKRHAEEELKEFNNINVLDPNNEYHLGKQFICDPEINMQDISTCKNLDLNDVQNNPSNYKLLIGKYGGPDLKNFCDKFAVDYFLSPKLTDKQKKARKEHFFLEIRHLLYGLKFFKDNGLVHYDLKPQNILFNLEDGTMKFIDFGIMTTKEKVLRDSKGSTNWLGTFHWSYPLETGFMNSNVYYSLNPLNITEQDKSRIIEEIFLQISSSHTMNNSKYPIKNPGAFLHMFTDYLRIKTKKQLSELINNLTGFFNFAKFDTYLDVLDKIIDSIDVYGVGFSLKYLVICLFNHYILNLSEYDILREFFDNMIHFNIESRITNIDVLINIYNIALNQLNVKVPNMPAPMRSSKMRSSNMRAPIRSPSIYSQSIRAPSIRAPSIRAQRAPIIKQCGPDKDLNPKTRRCVNKCKPGYTRTANFKCRKIPQNFTLKKKKSFISPVIPYISPVISPVINNISNTIPSSNQYIHKITDFVIQCGPDKDLNPKTKRCVKKCQSGYTRNADFKCRKGRRGKI
jgi:serine/threonine protein kinase